MNLQIFSSPEKNQEDDPLRKFTYYNIGDQDCYEETEEDSSLYVCPDYLNGNPNYNVLGTRRPFSPPFKQLT